MFKLLIILIFSLFGISGQCQILQAYINDLRPTADISMKQYFDSSLFPSITCENVYIFRGKTASRKSCAENTFLDMRTDYVGFQYKFYSAELNHTFKFYVTVDRNKKIRFGSLQDSAIDAQIPPCIRKRKTCSLISRDSALLIVNREYRDNYDSVDIWLEKPNPKVIEYFWIAVIHPENEFTSKAENGVMVSTQQKKRGILYLNATNGELMSREQYKLLRNK
jgi:hypothetical protein